MNMVRKFLIRGNMPYLVCREFKWSLRIASSFHTQNVKLLKMFYEKENSHAYSIIKQRDYAKPFPDTAAFEKNVEDISEYLKKDWSNAKPEEKLEAFKSLGNYAKLHNSCISQPQYDQFIDQFTDSIKELNDEQLKEVFIALKIWPVTPSVRTRNFIEVWAALDDAMIARFKDWSFEKVLEFVSYTYWLNIAKVCDFSEKAIQKVVSRGSNLTKSQIILTYFYIGLLRRAPLEMHNLEVMLRKDLSQYTVEDLAVIAMGMFKSRTPMRSKELMNEVISKIIKESESINEISLASLLKLIRYSLKNPENEIIYELLSALEKQVPRLSIMCCVHIALLGTATMTLHKKCLDKVTERCVQDISNTRLKDLERLVLTLAAFNYMPNYENFLGKIVNELEKPERGDEILKYPRPFACCVSYLTMFQCYPYKLFDKILDTTFLNNAYDNPYMYGREILMIDNTIEIECKDYSGNRLDPKISQKLAKKYTDYVPDANFKKEYNIAEKIVLDVISTLRKGRGGEQYAQGDHVLPHFQRGDVLVCDDTNGCAVDVSKLFPMLPFGTIKYVPDDNIWYAFVIAGRNAYIRNTDDVIGYFSVKLRQLKQIGYHPVVVNYKIWNNLRTHEEKSDYLSEIMDKSRKENTKVTLNI